MNEFKKSLKIQEKFHDNYCFYYVMKNMFSQLHESFDEFEAIIFEIIRF